MPESVGKSVEKLKIKFCRSIIGLVSKWNKNLMSEEAKLALDIFELTYNSKMNNILSITSKAANNNKIMSNAQKEWTLIIGVDKSGCSGYS